jgi:glycosyltransferase involved in cell wall biosynthesis
MVLRAAEDLWAGGASMKLVFTGSARSGDPLYLEELRALVAESAFSARVTILEDTSHTDLSILMRSCSMFIQASAKEGLGSAALEAMAFGKAVILTRTTGFDEYAKNGINAIVVDATTEDLSRALGKLLTDAGYARRLGRSAQEFVRVNFDLRSSVTDHLAAYEHALRRREVVAPHGRKIAEEARPEGRGTDDSETQIHAPNDSDSARSPGTPVSDRVEPSHNPSYGPTKGGMR